MNSVAIQPDLAQRLNHLEFAHRPGQRELVHALFDLLGFGSREIADGELIIGVVDPAAPNAADNNNILVGREVRPEQWALDLALSDALRHEPLASAFDAHRRLLTHRPQFGTHFGIDFRSFERWEAVVARIADVETCAPTLRGRVRLLKVFRPDDPEPTSSVFYAAFLWTDVIASGSLAFGQLIELSYRAQPNAEPYGSGPEAVRP
jgi:hypothetical protein